MTYKNKDVYSGNWSEGNKDGRGTFIFEQTHQKYVGHWISGQMVSGKWVYENGTYFSGNFDNNKPKAAGKWHFENGNEVSGIYRQVRKAEDTDDEYKIVWNTTGDITA